MRYERVVRTAVAALGVWTLATHAVVVAGGGLDALIGLAAVLVLAAVWIARRTADGAAPTPGGDAAVLEPIEPVPPVVRAATTLGAIAAAGTLLRDPVGPGFWWWMVAALAAGLAFTVPRLRAEEPAPVPPRMASPGAWPWLLAAASAAFTLVLHQPEPDDGWFAAISARAVDAPSAPLHGLHPVYGPAGVPMPPSPYRAHSLELIPAAISRVTGLEVLPAFHLLLGPLIAALVPLAYLALYRRLLPGRELRATLVTLVVFVLLPRTPYGGEVFTQPWIGTTTFRFLLVPVLASAAWDLARFPDLRRFGSLAIVQVAAIGATATALWASPVTVTYFGLAALALRAPAGRRVRAAALGLASCAYPVLVGLVVRSSLRATWIQPAEGVLPVDATPVPGLVSAPSLARAIHGAIGQPSTLVAIVLVVCCGWGWQRRKGPLAIAVVIPGAFALTLGNPWVSELVAYNVTSLYVYERVLWVLPVPILLALFGDALLESARRWSRSARLAVVATTVAVIASASVWTGFRTHGWGNLSILGFPPGLKVPHPHYEVARRLHEIAGPGRTVLAVRWIALWLPTMHRPPVPVASRRQYLDGVYGLDRQRERFQRLLLSAFVGDEIDVWRPFPIEIPDLVAYFEEGLQELRPDVVCLAPGTARRADVVAALERTGYAHRESVAGYAVWLLGDADPQGPGPR